jgi:predicted HicB family RNase H-like nuclease
MEYKGYTAAVEFDDEAGVFHGVVQHLRDVITFEGTSVEELRREFHASVEDYLEFCARRGKEPERPYSGKVLLRLPPELHRDAATCASREKASLNAWLVSAVAEKVAKQQVSRRVASNLATPAEDQPTAEVEGRMASAVLAAR